MVSEDTAAVSQRGRENPLFVCRAAGKLVGEMKQPRKERLSKREIAKRLGVSRTSVIRLLRPKQRA